MMHFTNQTGLSRRQAGSSLVVSMIMLAVLMLMGVGAIVVSNTQYRMAGNFQFQNQAMAAAESALSRAELWITENVTNPEFTTRVAGGHYPPGTGPDPYTMAWDDTTSETVGGDSSQRYIIEVLGANRYLPASSVKTCPGYTLSGPCSRVNVYRITARGTSGRGSVKIVQTVFTVQVSI